MRGSVFGSLGGVTPPPSRILADSAVLLFLAMPMLAVGGILFLITNLQVRGGRGHGRDLGAGGRRHKPPTALAASDGGAPAGVAAPGAEERLRTRA